MIVVFDLNGVFFTNGFALGMRKIANHAGVEQQHVERVFDTPDAKAYRAGMHDSAAFWESASKHFDNVPAVKELLFSSYVPVEEARFFSDRLRTAGIVTGFLSNSPHDRSLYLEAKHKFKKHFDFGLFSFEAGARKPDKKIYLGLLEICSAAASEIVFVDDKEENLAPARELGMKTVLFRNFSQLEKELKQLGLKL